VQKSTRTKRRPSRKRVHCNRCAALVPVIDVNDAGICVVCLAQLPLF
jgi:hypothetical protein